MKLKDIFTMAWRTVSANKVRAIITISIIAFGIMALIGILTAIQAMEGRLKDSFSSLGSNSFSIRFKERQLRIGRQSNVKQVDKKNERKANLNKPFTLLEATAFKNEYALDGIKTAISLGFGIQRAIVYGSIKTNPNVRSFGIDENYFDVSGYSVEYGRNFSQAEIEAGENVVVIGADILSKLFNGKADKAINSSVSVGGIQTKIIGILKSKGSGFFVSTDNVVFIPYNLERRFAGTPDNYSIGVKVNNMNIMRAATSEAEGLFRRIRKLDVTDENNFFIESSDSIGNAAVTSLGFITLAAAAIGFITLFGAAIGLMNIMLVAVTERTQEIGLTKALGAKKAAIRKQFLFESVIISLLGAAFGIILGIAVGNLVGKALGTSFFIPWRAVIIGIVTCSITGLLAGLYPSFKAARLEPIQALRYE
jgi:putative ABC transport system permease protein